MTADPLKKQGFVGLLGAARMGEPGGRIPEVQKVWEDARTAGAPPPPPEATGPGTVPKFSRENGNKHPGRGPG